jgi:hypothetical protein
MQNNFVLTNHAVERYIKRFNYKGNTDSAPKVLKAIANRAVKLKRTTADGQELWESCGIYFVVKRNHTEKDRVCVTVLSNKEISSPVQDVDPWNEDHDDDIESFNVKPNIPVKTVVAEVKPMPTPNDKPIYCKDVAISQSKSWEEIVEFIAQKMKSIKQAIDDAELLSEEIKKDISKSNSNKIELLQQSLNEEIPLRQVNLASLENKNNILKAIEVTRTISSNAETKQLDHELNLLKYEQVALRLIKNKLQS